MASFEEFYQSLPEDSNKRGEVFEREFIPWFLKTDPEWSTKVKEIWLWDEYPERWGKDCGIDLVYEDQQGKHWAVQSKCISPDREISKAEIDSFLSESNDARIHGRLLIASTDGIGKNALQVIERQEKQVVCFLREHFWKSEVVFPSSVEDLSTGQRKERRTPRPHQKEAIQNVVAGLQIEERGQLLMACGTGKTLTSLWIKEALNSKRTLVLLPSLSLLSQTLREWTATSQEAFNWICVCSDKSVAKQDKSTDDWIENVSELGIPVTSDPSDIRSFLVSAEEGIVFSTYQSSPLVAEAQKTPETPAFDIAFADEAHRCAGKVSAAFSCILDTQKIRAVKRLFMTATPRVLSNRIKSRAEIEDIEIASMDDEGLFGKVLHKLNFSEAIEGDLLTDYRVVVVGVDDPDIQTKIINRPLTSTGTGVDTDYETLANHISLSKSVINYDLRRVITFHSRVKAAKKFSEDHTGIVDWLTNSSTRSRSLKTAYVSGEMTSLERNKKINQLRNLTENETGILSNARCLSEGVDVPTLDGIAFIDPRRSQVDIIQAVGRAIRKSDSKSYGYIVIPVYLGDTEDIEEEIIASRFKDVWEIILALKSQDDSLADVLDRLRIELGSRGSVSRNDQGLIKIIFDIPQRVKNIIGDSLTTILVKNTTDEWEEKYGELLQFVKNEGHARPKRDHQVLGLWTVMQRQKHKKDRLPKYRIGLLEKLEGWTWDPGETDWQDKFEKLVNYVHKNGHARPPQSFPELGSWVASNRNNFNNGKLPRHRKELLESLDGWTWDAREAVWREKYEKMMHFALTCGHAKRTKENKSVWTWIDRNRQEKKEGTLSEERINLLELIPGWIWNEIEHLWETRYSELLEYVKIHGNATPPKRKGSPHRVLAMWVEKQRCSYFDKSILEERKSRLEEIQEWSWDPVTDRWNKNYLELKDYINQFGHSTPSRKTHQRLGEWVGTLRTFYNKGKLSEEQIQRLQELPHWVWDRKEAAWNENYQLLLEFVIENGHANVPQKHPQLGLWISNQRGRYSKGELDKDRVLKLESIEGWEWNAKDAAEREKRALLVGFIKVNGHSNVPYKHPILGHWVYQRRKLFQEKKLSNDQIRVLEAIDGWVWQSSE